MIVCLCRGISDRQIVQLVAEGARSSLEVARACGAGLECGTCVPTVNQIIVTHSNDPTRPCPPDNEDISTPSVLHVARAETA